MKIISHFRTITRHRHKVMSNCFKCGIFWQGLVHDLSKYSITEFRAGAKYYEGTRSPTEKEREEKGYSLAWMHHKGRNKHHFEYWVDISPITKQYEPVPMPIKYVVEMFCDRVAASKIYMGEKYTDASPYLYYMTAKGKDYMHRETSARLEEYLVMLKDKGEKYTFNYIKKQMKNKK